MIYNVVLSERADKQLEKIPKYIKQKLDAWIEAVMYEGLENTRKITSYHDEPLKDWREGQRSIRLSKAYRAIYRITFDNKIKIAYIIEVNKHEY